ncbi:MAG: ATP-binding protein [Phycisphaerales bacterium JB040]
MMLPDGPNQSSRTNRVPPTASDAGPAATDRVTELAHELSNMLDGSLRWLSLAARALPGGEPMHDSGDATLEETRHHIERARASLETMSRVVGAAMRPVPIGSPLHPPGAGVSLGEAIEHAIEIARLRQPEVELEFDVQIGALVGQGSAGPLYSVFLNGMINAAESIARCRKPGAVGVRGRIEVEAGVVEVEGVRTLTVEIRDDGEGLRGVATREGWAFGRGNTSKPGGSGLGLALAKRTVEEIGGGLTLETRTERRASTDRPGACLRLRMPMPRPEERAIGGEGAD